MILLHSTHLSNVILPSTAHPCLYILQGGASLQPSAGARRHKTRLSPQTSESEAQKERTTLRQSSVSEYQLYPLGSFCWSALRALLLLLFLLLLLLLLLLPSPPPNVTPKSLCSFRFTPTLISQVYFHNFVSSFSPRPVPLHCLLFLYLNVLFVFLLSLYKA